MVISAQSKEYVKVPVYVTLSGAVRDPHTDVVAMAFPVRGVAPVTGDWKTGSWELLVATDPRTGASYQARVLVGPGGDVTLVAGNYDVWLRITDSPEVPVRKVGILQVTA